MGCSELLDPPVQHYRLIDATTKDGRKVYLKKVYKDSNERKIAVYLSSDGKLSDPRNHCVPILDYFDDKFEPFSEFIVMPLLRAFDSPPFIVVDEVLGFVKQTLEVSELSHRICEAQNGPQGLSFIHSHNVAHR